MSHRLIDLLQVAGSHLRGESTDDDAIDAILTALKVDSILEGMPGVREGIYESVRKRDLAPLLPHIPAVNQVIKERLNIDLLSFGSTFC